MNYYNEISKGYEELHREEQLGKIKLIKKHFNPKGKLLDVGCGTGITTIPWKCKLYGLDPAIQLLKRASKKNRPTYLNAEAEHIPFKDNTFEVVISITAIQNFHDIEKGLKEIKRVGKNKFLLTFLKKSRKKQKIIKLIKKHFKITKELEEQHDLIYFLAKK